MLWLSVRVLLPQTPKPHVHVDHVHVRKRARLLQYSQVASDES